MSILYLSYDGVLEPLGQSQVLRYLERLVEHYPIVLISFEKAKDWQAYEHREALRNHLHATGITWVPLTYHKAPSAVATAFDIFQGIAVGGWVVVRHRVRVVHARSYVPSVIALALKKMFGLKYVFDMRGFWVDERVDGGLWPRDGRLFRLAKWFERQFLLNADHVVSLTNAAGAAIEKFPYLAGRLPPISVIPTCADLDRFRPQTTVRERFVLGYVGSAGTWYEFDAAVAFFSELRRERSDARFLVINRAEQDYIRERLLAGGVPRDAVEIQASNHSEVHRQMARMHAAVFFYKPAFSRLATAPTKLGEFLGCGLPCLSNRGVGDTAEVLEAGGVGVTISDFSTNSMREGLRALLRLVDTPDIAERCALVAQRHFSLRDGVRKYLSVYQSLT